jgi:hypothetical protein
MDGKPTVVVVHSPRAATAEPKRMGRGGVQETAGPGIYSCAEGQKLQKCEITGPLRAVLPKGSDGRDPRNYLLSGGTRALDKDREKQQAQAAREKVKVCWQAVEAPRGAVQAPPWAHSDLALGPDGRVVAPTCLQIVASAQPLVLPAFTGCHPRAGAQDRKLGAGQRTAAYTPGEREGNYSAA